MSAPTPAAYFDDLWAGSDDPWEHTTRYYETRKYDMTVAALDRAHYRRAFEPGCGTGLLTTRLAPRADEVVAWDRHDRAVDVTAARTAGARGVEVAVGSLPDVAPGPFDLFVFSEVLYYLVPEQLDLVRDGVERARSDDATLVAVHYRLPVPEHALLGDDVHERVGSWPGWVRHGGYLDGEFRLDLWRRDRPAR